MIFKTVTTSVPLLLVLITAAITLLASFSRPGVMARKEIHMAPSISEALPFIRCKVCEHAMFYTVRHTLDYIAEAGLNEHKKLKEDKLIDHVLFPLCIPFTTEGQWLRGADWELVKNETQRANAASGGDGQHRNNDGDGADHDEKEATQEKVQVRFKVHEDTNFRCGEKCSTAAAACDDMLMFSDNADKITSILIKSYKKLVSLTDSDDETEPVRVAQSLIKSVCKQARKWRTCPTTVDISSAQSEKTASNKKRNNNNKRKKKNDKFVSATLSSPLVPMESKEVEVEEMMYRMKHGLKKKGPKEDNDDTVDESGRGDGGGGGQPGVDVYSRDEMLEMRGALTSGDRERLREIDPQSEELSDEEFALLSQMHKNEFKGGSRPEGEVPLAEEEDEY